MATELKFSDLSKVFPTADAKPKPIPMQTSGDNRPRILLADQDPVFALSLFPSLVQAGYEVVVTEVGTDAIAELRKADHPPVAILNRGLPGMDGIEISERMRDAGKNLYLVLISDQPSTQEIVAGLEAGADLFVAKSIPAAELLAHVKVGMRITQRQRAAAGNSEE